MWVLDSNQLTRSLSRVLDGAQPLKPTSKAGFLSSPANFLLPFTFQTNYISRSKSCYVGRSLMLFILNPILHKFLSFSLAPAKGGFISPFACLPHRNVLCFFLSSRSHFLIHFITKHWLLSSIFYRISPPCVDPIVKNRLRS